MHFIIFLNKGDFCRVLIIFAKRLDPNQDRHNVGPDLDQPVAFLKDFLKKLMTTKTCKITQHAELITIRVKYKIVNVIFFLSNEVN